MKGKLKLPGADDNGDGAGSPLVLGCFAAGTAERGLIDLVAVPFLYLRGNGAFNAVDTFYFPVGIDGDAKHDAAALVLIRVFFGAHVIAPASHIQLGAAAAAAGPGSACSRVAGIHFTGHGAVGCAHVPHFTGLIAGVVAGRGIAGASSAG